MRGKAQTLKFATIPAWVKPEQAHKTAIFEAVALLGLEGQWLRMTADDQRALIGFPVFGKQEFMVNSDGTFTVRRSACFGMDYEQCDYSAAKAHKAATAGKRLSPGVYGPGYYNEAEDK